MINTPLTIKRHHFIGVLLLFTGFISNGQLINLPQAFSPKASLAHDYASRDNFTTNTSLLNAAFPLKTKLGLRLDLTQKIKGIEGIEDVLKVQFSQKLIGVTIRNTVFSSPTIKQTQQRVGLSFTSIHYQKKLHFLLYRFGGSYYHTPNAEHTAFSVNGLVAKMHLINLHNVLFYGAIGMWNHGNRFLLPVVGWMHKIDRSMSYTLIFPSSAKFTYKVNRTLKLDATTYVNTLRNQVVENNVHYSYQLSQLRSGAQVRWHLGRSSVLNLEGGIEYFSRLNQWKGFEKQTNTQLPTRPFVKATFFFTFGKSLFNADVLNINLE